MLRYFFDVHKPENRELFQGLNIWHDAEGLRRDIHVLLSGGTMDKSIEENFVFSDLNRQKDLLWTLMLFSGYLTVVQRVDYDEYELRIPNFELKLVFKRTVL